MAEYFSLCALLQKTGFFKRQGNINLEEKLYYSVQDAKINNPDASSKEKLVKGLQNYFKRLDAKDLDEIAVNFISLNIKNFVNQSTQTLGGAEFRESKQEHEKYFDDLLKSERDMTDNKEFTIQEAEEIMEESPAKKMNPESSFHRLNRSPMSNKYLVRKSSRNQLSNRSPLSNTVQKEIQSKIRRNKLARST